MGEAWPLGKELYQYDKDANIVVLDAGTGMLKRVLVLPADARDSLKNTESVLAEVSWNQRYVAVGAGLSNRSAAVLDYKNGMMLALLKLPGSTHQLSFSGDNKYLIANGTVIENNRPRRLLTVWDTETWKLIREIRFEKLCKDVVSAFTIGDVVLTVNSNLVDENKNDGRLFKTEITAYAIKSGECVLKYDTDLATDNAAFSAIYIEDLNAICMGTAKGFVYLVAVPEMRKKVD